MKRLVALLLLATAASAHAQCRLCAPGAEALRPIIPLNISVEAALDLGRAAQTRPGGAGAINIDPQSGARTVTGTLADLGGMSLKGTIRLIGQPFAPVMVSLPNSITLTAPDGSSANVIDIKSDIAPNATLNLLGQLVIGFGGRLVVTNGTSGDLRGRIPITADYR